MPLILRKIKKAKWYRNIDVPWLKPGELQADALADLKTTGNRLSVWLIQDDKSNLERVIAALASTCDVPTNIDFVLMDQSELQRLGIKWENTKGDSHDEQINHTHHLDLLELTATKLYDFANQIQVIGIKERYLEKTVMRLLIGAIRAGLIPQSKLKDRLRSEIGYYK